MRKTMSINRLMVVGVAMAGMLAANGTQAQPSQTQTAQQQPQAQQPLMPPRPATRQEPYATYPLQMVIGSHGYFEVTPAGSLVFYPVWTTVEPAVMHTIFGMMAATSYVGQRGFYDVTSDVRDAGERQVRFFLPPGSTPGLVSPESPRPSTTPPATER